MAPPRAMLVAAVLVVAAIVTALIIAYRPFPLSARMPRGMQMSVQQVDSIFRTLPPAARARAC